MHDLMAVVFFQRHVFLLFVQFFIIKTFLFHNGKQLDKQITSGIGVFFQVSGLINSQRFNLLHRIIQVISSDIKQDGSDSGG